MLVNLLAIYIVCLCLEWIQPSVAELSVLKCFEIIVVDISLSSKPDSSAPSVAAYKSSFGMLSFLIGATFVLLITYRDVEYPSAFVVLAYTMTVVALIEVSVNV